MQQRESTLDRYVRLEQPKQQQEYVAKDHEVSFRLLFCLPLHVFDSAFHARPLCNQSIQDRAATAQIRITGPGKTRSYIAYATGLLAVSDAFGTIVQHMPPSRCSTLLVVQFGRSVDDMDLYCWTQQKGCNAVELKAMGQAINKTVTIGQ